MKVLVADDDVELVDLLGWALRRAGYEVVNALDGQQALDRWQAEKPDFVLLDGHMPKLDGFEVCRRIRHESKTPVILLTARDKEEEVIRGLQVGADDYVTKPFSPTQLLARIQAVLRRTRDESERQASNEVRVGDLVLDRQSHGVTKGGAPVRLTRLQFRILYLLAANVGRVMPFSRLYEYGSGYYDEDSSMLLKTHMSHLRRKLGLGTRGPHAIQAVIGVGYRLTWLDEDSREPHTLQGEQ